VEIFKFNQVKRGAGIHNLPHFLRAKPLSGEKCEHWRVSHVERGDIKTPTLRYRY